jgi:uncharacterized phage protein (TIGR02218 family)
MFADREESRAKGRPITLFLIRYGDSPNSYYAYTDSTSDITRAGVTYKSVAIQRGAIVVKGTMDKNMIEVRMALDLEVAELFRIYPPSSVVSLVISQGHVDDTEFLAIWAGRVSSAKREPPELILSCEPVRSAMRGVGLRINYQYSCSHVLYGPQCRADKTAATSYGAVVPINGAKVTITSGWDTSLSNGYIGGMVEWENAQGNTESRTILRVNGNILSLSGPMRDVSNGDTVRVVRGCARDMDACRSHNNILNFGGCPYIPKKNPIGYINNFY